MKPVSPSAILDIGDAAITAILGHTNATGFEIAATATVSSLGIHNGAITDATAAAGAIREAVAEVQHRAGYQIASAVVCIDGDHLRSFTSHGLVAVGGAPVTPKDLERVKVAAGAVDVPADRQVLAVDPVAYAVDDRSGVTDPLGTAGHRLELEARVVTANKGAVARVIETCKLAGVDVERVVPRAVTPLR